MTPVRRMLADIQQRTVPTPHAMRVAAGDWRDAVVAPLADHTKMVAALTAVMDIVEEHEGNCEHIDPILLSEAITEALA